MAALDIDTRHLDDSTVVLDVKGDLDAFSVTQFRHAAAENNAVPRLIINLGATFLDSAGLNALVGAVRQVRDHRGDAAVVCAHPRIAGILHTTGFDRVVTLSNTIEEARSALDLLNGEVFGTKYANSRNGASGPCVGRWVAPGQA
jgi:anti-sigma B factor antagonist